MSGFEIHVFAGICKISDFGLSRIKNESVTQISGMLGTPGYPPPSTHTHTPHKP